MSRKELDADLIEIPVRNKSNESSIQSLSSADSLLGSSTELINIDRKTFIRKYDANSELLYKRYKREIGQRLHMKSFQMVSKREKIKWYKYIQYLLCFIFLFPIRAVFSIFQVILCFIVITISTSFENLDKNYIKNPNSEHFEKPVHRIPKAKWRRKIINISIKISAKLILFLGLGFFKIKVNDLRKRDENGKIITSPLIISNHNSLVDILIISACIEEAPSFLSMNWVRSVPFIGRVADGLQCVYVSPKSSGLTSEIVKRVEETKKYNLPPLVIFPEGTTTNGTHLIDFRYGAFNPLTPVQPIAIKYKFKYYNPCWVVDSGVKYIFETLSQFRNDVEVTLLPVIDFETEEERTNVDVWKNKCSKVLQKALKIPRDLLASRPQKMAYEKYLRGKATFEETEEIVNQCIQKKKMKNEKYL